MKAMQRSFAVMASVIVALALSGCIRKAKMPAKPAKSPAAAAAAQPLPQEDEIAKAKAVYAEECGPAMARLREFAKAYGIQKQRHSDLFQAGKRADAERVAIELNRMRPPAVELKKAQACVSKYRDMPFSWNDSPDVDYAAHVEGSNGRSP